MTSAETFYPDGLPTGKSLILFDGYCNLCNGAVQFVLKRDKKRQFYFASLSWEVAEQLLEKYPEFKLVDSILLFENNKLRAKSSAALKIAPHLGGLWWMTGIFWVVPKFVRDGIYNWIARNRYKWFGKKEACMMPTPELKSRFLEGKD